MFSYVALVASVAARAFPAKALSATGKDDASVSLVCARVVDVCLS